MASPMRARPLLMRAASNSLPRLLVASNRPLSAVARSGSSSRQHHNEGGSSRWRTTAVAGAAGAAAAALAAGLYHERYALNAESGDKAENEVLEKESRIRQFGTLVQIFEYFASYQHLDVKGKKTILMSVKDFYNSITPGSTLTHGTGAMYVAIHDEDIGSRAIYEQERVPVRDSILNRIQNHGLITFADFAFLLNIVSTPRRYMDIAFHAFDVSADGKIEAKEFAHVMAKVNYTTN